LCLFPFEVNRFKREGGSIRNDPFLFRFGSKEE